jgi:hypothetical protein
MALTQEQIDHLKTLLANGVQQVTLAGESVTYFTPEQILEAIAAAERDLAAATGTAQRYRLAITSKGIP